MNKQQLQAILSSPYDQAVWKHVLIEVFGVKRILQTPQPIYLSNTQKASEAYELGSFSTKDDRIIGIYQVNVNPEVWLERNKVGLRTLLRDVYKYDVDGAIIVFVQENKWRLSFVSEIKTLNEKGEIQTQATEPRRYTYLLGEGEKVLTPAQNLAKIAGKPLTLEDIRNAFSVEALNEEFYKIIAQQFYELVGATAGKGKNIRTYERKLQLPSTSDAKTYQEFAVRLIGRTIFCWFLKVKKSDGGLSLLPEHLLGSAAVGQFPNYYHTVLERLFFQTLNTPMEKRITDLPEGANFIPFLNGGLFDYQEDDFYIPNKTTGLSENINTLIIPDQWFLSFFQELEKYNFTIDENSTVDIEVSVDPEMLGRIFENLLAEIDPDSGETARKATGSFYTPREIVDYMATESLIHYLHNKTAIEKESLSMLFKIDSQIREDSVLITQKVAILEALDTLKILDPACGSGAFPMGVLQKIVMALQKIDPNSEWWKNKQIEKNDNPILRSIIREKLNAASVEYARKIGIIQNTLYGVDIQPIAAEISKLRCFLTLIVDENIDENKPNRGVEPLPNLEFKFVTADSLRKLPLETNYGGLFNANDDLEQLKRIRQDYLQSFGDEKATLKTKFKEIQDRVAQQQFSLGKNIDTNSRAYLIGTWKPFSHEKVDWFDPEWMFGIKGFDIMIGNPPYVRIQNLDKSLKETYAKTYKTATKNYDIYVLFNERGMQLLNDAGSLIYIQPNKFFNADYGIGLRKYLTDNNWLYQIVDFKAEQMFSTATTYTCILHSVKKKQEIITYISFKGDNKQQSFRNFSNNYLTNNIEINKYDFSNHSDANWSFGSSIFEDIFKKIELNNPNLSYYTEKVFQGLVTGADPIYILEKSKNGYFSRFLNEEIILEEPILKPLLKGAEIRRYKIDFQKLYIIFPYKLQNGKAILLDSNSIKNDYPKTWNYFISCEEKLKSRDNGKIDKVNWYGYSRNQNISEFNQPKIMTQVLANKASMVYDQDENYHFVGGGNAGGYGIVLKENSQLSYWYLLALLNSRLLDFYLQNHSSPFQNNYFSYAKRYIENIPVKITDANTQKPFIIIAQIIQYIIKLKNTINEYVPNSHIVDIFEEVIDGMVYELYFKEDFEAVNIEFIKYAERDFKSIEGIDDESEKIKIIHEAYQKLREKDNEIRNNLKLMLIELKDLLTPIITAK